MRAYATQQSSHDSAMRKHGGPKNPPPLQERNLPAPSNGVAILQPKASCPCGGGCPRCQGELDIQPKLRIGRPNDKYEQEADRVGEMVMRMPEPQGQQQAVKEEEEEEEEEVPIQTKPVSSQITPLVQRQVELEKEFKPEKEEEEEQIQTKSSSISSQETTAPSTLQSQLNTSKGQPLHQGIKTSMESAFGADFSGVRIHKGQEAINMNQSLNAQAFTHGADIYFNQGKFNPDSTEGKKLLAHELTHVMQQQAANESLNVLQRAPDDDKEYVAYPIKVPRDIKTDEERHVSNL